MKGFAYWAVFGAIGLLFLTINGCNFNPVPSQPDRQAHGIVPVTVTITRFIQIDDPDPAPGQGDGDYYARVTINGLAAQDNESSQVEAEDFEPFWVFTRNVDTNTVGDTIIVIIEILDDDTFLAAPDDDIDINPVDGVLDLTLIVDLTTGNWSSPGVIPANQGWSQGDGDTEHSGIFEGGERGKVFFDISVLSADGDADGDGLLDGWELHGLDADGNGTIDVDLPGFGADPNHKDLFLEFDWVTGQQPTRAAIQALKAAFAIAPISAGTNASALPGGIDAKPNPDGLPGINLWVDTGNLMEGGLLVGDNLGGGNAVGGPVGCLDGNFYTTKGANFAAGRRLVFRYGISGDPADNNPCNGGRGEIGGNDFIEYNHDAGTIMHELGHNLNLRHGGNVDGNCTPNYVSVMNYDNQFGINQAGGGTIIDYAPPRFPGGRGSAALPTLVENNLNENTILDATDATNRFVFTNINGTKVQSPLNQQIDWNSDGDTSDAGLTVNIDTADDNGTPADTSDDFPGACLNNASNSSLNSHDDWSRIALQFRQFGDSANGAVNPVQEPEIDLTELLQLQEALQTTDLAITKSDDPDPVAAGTELTYTLTVSNNGPNPANSVQVIDVLPAGVTYQSDTAGCVEAPAGTLTCALGEILANASRQLSITVLVAADLVYNNGGPLTITNTASVRHGGTDPAAGNDGASEDTLVVAVADLEIVDFEVVDAPEMLVIGETADVTLRKTITNNGPSAPMDVALTATATAQAGSTITPPLLETTEDALGLDELRVVEETFTIECQGFSQHTFTVSNFIEPLNPEDTDPDLSNNDAEVEFTVECVIPVAINIKPRSDPNSINPGKDTVPVAVLTTMAGEYGLPLDFDATTILPLSVRFGTRDEVWTETGGAFETHRRGHIERSYELDEITRDADNDMVLHFKAADTGIQSGVTEACVLGTWLDNVGGEHSFFGCDAVRTVPN